MSGQPRQAKRWLATNDVRWIRIRDRHLAIEPTCRRCGAGDSLEVDHIDGQAVCAHDYRDSNLQTLCSTCHAVKTASENGSFGRKPGASAPRGCDAQGRPLDPKHHWRKT